VNLRTGTLGPSDPALLFTKVAGCDYEPGATSDDWDKALDALEDDDREHLRIRLGQAATGHPTPSDDVLIARGGGANGKTTLLGTVFRAIGEYAVLVSDKALMGNTRDHPTELMPFRGARLALLEETPEARRLEVARLKRLVGTETMTARLIAANPVSWEPTHTLIITTNYDPLVEETDHGTWRRLKMLRFSKTYTGANLDTNLRPRLRRRNSPGQKAALAWVIEGAVRYYTAGEEIPDPTPNMAAETARWRGVSDPVASFIAEHLAIDTDMASKHAVLSTDVLTQFNYWLEERGHRPWSETLLVQRLDGHEAFSMGGVERRRMRTASLSISRPRNAALGSAPAQAWVWLGLVWASPAVPFWESE
jgi:putative DNA primase/helicase